MNSRRVRCLWVVAALAVWMLGWRVATSAENSSFDAYAAAENARRRAEEAASQAEDVRNDLENLSYRVDDACDQLGC